MFLASTSSPRLSAVCVNEMVGCVHQIITESVRLCVCVFGVIVFVFVLPLGSSDCDDNKTSD